MLLKKEASRPSLRDMIKKGIVIAPGAYDAITAMIIEKAGFNAVYVTGSGLSTSLTGYPDLGLLTLNEVVSHARYIADAVTIPVIVDADTGYGEAINVIRAVKEFESAGISAIQIEDQVMPKRCGHLDGKELVSAEEMAKKVVAAVEARKSDEFLVIARTDARAVEGLEGAIKRAKMYVEAGADIIFPEALTSEEEFAVFAKQIKAPLLANMTEFGKTPYISVKKFKELGYKIVIFPMTAFRVMVKAVWDAMNVLKEEGTQVNILNMMKSRDEIYDLIGYDKYINMDKKLANKVKSL